MYELIEYIIFLLSSKFLILFVLGFIGLVLLILIINDKFEKYRNTFMIIYFILGIIASFIFKNFMGFSFDYVLEYVLVIATIFLYPIYFIGIFIFIIAYFVAGILSIPL